MEMKIRYLRGRELNAQRIPILADVLSNIKIYEIFLKQKPMDYMQVLRLFFLFFKWVSCEGTACIFLQKKSQILYMVTSNLKTTRSKYYITAVYQFLCVALSLSLSAHCYGIYRCASPVVCQYKRPPPTMVSTIRSRLKVFHWCSLGGRLSRNEGKGLKNFKGRTKWKLAQQIPQ